MIKSSCYIATLSIPKLKWNNLASNMGLSGKKPVINRLRYDRILAFGRSSILENTIAFLPPRKQNYQTLKGEIG
jgi:hypothetical protein